MLWAAMEMLSLYFMTDVAKLEPRLAGALFCLFMVFNAFCDPFVGAYWDRKTVPPSKSYYAVGMSLTALLFILTFATVGTGTATLIVIILSGLALRIGFSAIDVPHNAMLARLTTSGCSPVRLSAVRFFAATMASIFTVNMAGFALRGGDASGRFALFALGLALIGVCLFLLFLPKQSSVPGLKPCTQMHAWPRARLLAACGVLMGAAIMAVIGGIYSKSAVYVAKYLFLDAGWASDALALFLSGRLASMVLLVVRMRDEQILGLLFPLAFCAASAGAIALFPPSRENYLVALALLGFAVGSINIVSWAALPSLVGDLRGAGFRLPEAFLFGLFTSLTKVGLAVSGLVLGWVVSLSGITQGAGGGAGTYMACGVIVLVGSLVVAAGFSTLMPRRRPWLTCPEQDSQAEPVKD